MLSTAFAALVRRSGMQSFRFHDLRHSHASHLLRAGIHPKIVSERLGHSTVGITLDTYSHVLPGMQEDAVRLLDAALARAMQKKQRRQDMRTREMAFLLLERQSRGEVRLAKKRKLGFGAELPHYASFPRKYARDNSGIQWKQ